MFKYVNLTPHVIRINGGTEFPPSGTVARVSTEYSEFDPNGACVATFGEVTGVPDPEIETVYIVSGMVASALKRPDVVAPATGHPDAVRVNGQVSSVPGFVYG